jgi:hypothetical protein
MEPVKKYKYHYLKSSIIYLILIFLIYQLQTIYISYYFPDYDKIIYIIIYSLLIAAYILSIISIIFHIIYEKKNLSIMLILAYCVYSILFFAIPIIIIASAGFITFFWNFDMNL